MTIGIVTYFFHPVQNPRAFRAIELATEFSRQGHRVIVYVPDTNYDYSQICIDKKLEIKTVSPGFYLNKKDRYKAPANPANKKADDAKSKPGILSRFKSWIIRNVYPGGFNFEYAFTCSKVLVKETLNFDLVISVGLPICSHLAVSRAKRKKPAKFGVCIADYGDPYSFSKIINPPYFHRWLEKRMLKRFDYILTPTAKGVEAFTYFKPADKIKVIPQGFDFSKVRLAERSGNQADPVHFVFSGNFYKTARNPQELFEFLVSEELNYRFTLYINTSDSDNLEMIEPFTERMKEKLIVRNFVERLECIYEMSKADFLVNISNVHDEHTPSKLIDYALTRRPVFSYTPGNFDPQIFRKFLSRDYSFDFSSSINLDDFDIRKVTRSILDLIPEK